MNDQAYLALQLAHAAESVRARMTRLHDALGELQRLACTLFKVTPRDPVRVAHWMADEGFGVDDDGYHLCRPMRRLVRSGQAAPDAISYFLPVVETLDPGLSFRLYALSGIGSHVARLRAGLGEGLHFIYYQDAANAAVTQPYVDPAGIIPPDFDWRTYYGYRSVCPAANPGRQVRWALPKDDYATQGLFNIVSLPVYLGDEFVGLWSIDVPLDYLERHCLTPRPPSGSSQFIANFDGNLLFHDTLGPVVNTAEKMLRWTPLAGLGGDFGTLDLRDLIRDGAGERELRDASGKSLAVFFHAVPEVEWLLFVTFPKRQMLEVVASEMTRAIGRMKTGDYAYRIAPAGAGETAALVEEYNRLAAALDESQAHRARAEARTAHLTAVLLAVRNVNQLITRERDPERLVQDACGLLVGTRGYTGAWIAMLGDDGRPHLRGAAGTDNLARVLSERFTQDALPDCWRNALENRGALVLTPPADLGGDPAPAAQDQIVMALSLAHGDRTLGLLVVTAPAAMAGDAEEQSLLREVAADLGLALHALDDRRKREAAVAALSASEERFRAVVEYAPDIIFIVDRNARIQFINRVPNGLSPAEVIGTDAVRYVADEYKETVRQHIDRVFETGQPSSYEIRARGPRDTIAWYHTRLAPMGMAADGTVRQVLILTDDITDLKQITAALEKNEFERAIILDNTAEIIALHDTNHVIQWANKAYLRATGLSLPELQTKKCYLSWGLDKLCINCPVTKAFETGQPVAAELTPQNQPHWPPTQGSWMISASPVKDSAGRITGAIEIASDITAHKQAEQALFNERERLRITLESIGDGVIATDLAGNVVLLNRVAEQLTGWKHHEAVTRPLAEVFRVVHEATRQPVQNPVQMVLDKGIVVGLANHTMLIARDGAERIIADSGAPIRDRDGQLAGVVLVFRDVTNERRMEQHLHEARKMESIGRLAGGVAHDFNNLLAGIMGYAELWRAGDTTTPADECAQNIIEISDRARDLIRQLLTFSRRSPRHSTPFDMHQVIRDVIVLLTHTMERSIEIRQHLTATKAVVMGDASLLQTALLNIAINSRDAMPGGGVLTFATTVVKFDTANCARHPGQLAPGNYLEISVTDTGTGMDAEVIDHIFEPFFTTKSAGQGVGLGLAAVYGTVKDHKGAIEVTSAPGRGTTMRLLLPLTDQPAAEVARPALEAVSGSGTILLVDDEEVVRITASKILSRAGYHVLSADSGEAAVRLFTEQPDGIDLVILDMGMPDMDGAQTYAALYRIRPDVKVLLSSGYIHNYEVQKLLDSGIIDFLQKPIRMAELTSKVAELLHKDTA